MHIVASSTPVPANADVHCGGAGLQLRRFFLMHYCFFSVGSWKGNASQMRLRELRRAHGGEIRLFCAHDAKEFEGFASAVAGPASTTARPLSQHA